MMRSALRLGCAAILLTLAMPAAAEERAANGLVPPSKAVADAWAREALEAEQAKGRQPSALALKVLSGSYSVLQGVDMYSTIRARNNGAREVNPVMDAGYVQAAAMKAAVTAVALAGVNAMAKKNRKAAIVTGIMINAVTAAVAVNNFRNARRLK